MTLACLNAFWWGLLGRALPPACHHSTVQAPLLAGRLTNLRCTGINEPSYDKHTTGLAPIA